MIDINYKIDKLLPHGCNELDHNLGSDGALIVLNRHPELEGKVGKWVLRSKQEGTNLRIDDKLDLMEVKKDEYGVELIIGSKKGNTLSISLDSESSKKLRKMLNEL